MEIHFQYNIAHHLLDNCLILSHQEKLLNSKLSLHDRNKSHSFQLQRLHSLVYLFRIHFLLLLIVDEFWDRIFYE